MVLLRAGATALAVSPTRRAGLCAGVCPSRSRTRLPEHGDSRPKTQTLQTTSVQPKVKVELLPPSNVARLVGGAEQREEPNPLRESAGASSASCASQLNCLVLQMRVTAYTQTVTRCQRLEFVAGNFRFTSDTSPFCLRTTNTGRPYRRFAWKSRHFHNLARKIRTQFCHA